jgi:hypothetical protein
MRIYQYRTPSLTGKGKGRRSKNYLSLEAIAHLGAEPILESFMEVNPGADPTSTAIFSGKAGKKMWEWEDAAEGSADRQG